MFKDRHSFRSGSGHKSFQEMLDQEFQRLKSVIQENSGLSPVEVDLLIEELDRLLKPICILQAIGYRLPSPHHDAEDLSQELWVKLYSRKFRIDTSDHSKKTLFRTLMTSLHNSCRDRKRKQSRHKEWDLEGADSDSSGDTLRTVQMNDLWEIVRGGIAELSEIEREILVHRYVEGRSSREMSEFTGIPYSTVNVHAHRAVSKLREHVYGKDLWPVDPSWK